MGRTLIDCVLAVHSQAPYENQNEVIDAYAELTYIISNRITQESMPMNMLNDYGSGPAERFG